MIQRAWEEVYSSFASRALASASTVERNVRSRLSKLEALATRERLALLERLEIQRRRQPAVEHELVNQLRAQASPRELGGTVKHALAEGLRISPAAVSGAVRYLTMTRLLFKERVPGSRADLYRVYDEDVWSTIMAARLPMLEVWEKAVHDAADTVGLDTPGGHRLRETEEFFRFTRLETAAMIERWKRHRSAVIAERNGAPRSPGVEERTT